MSDDVASWLGDARTWADLELDQALPPPSIAPGRLHEAMRYAVFGGGKRLRPALVLLVAEHFGATARDAALPAIAIECVHTYSLVHDDLPCMDDDDLRRGRATCHKVYGEALAVLAGDALLTFAFETLARAGTTAGELVRALSSASGSRGMVGGQALDLSTDSSALTLDRVAEIHRWKTAVLFGAAAEMGAIVAGAAREHRTLARDFGVSLGRSFQAIDDVLDVTGDAATLGKTPGKDARARKPTLVAALGLDRARAEAERLSHEAQAASRALGAREGQLAFDVCSFLLARRA